ncbi:MAG TPA: plastocyanin/azurin family copper-binding protein [Solirubrobacteraceae bacterium]|jgi:plastocyanin
MNKHLSAVLLAGVTLLSVAGCGSESTSSSSSTTAPTRSAASSTGPKSSGLKVASTPKFASPSSSAAVQSGAVQISYREITIEPDTLKVKVGSTIKWTNYDSIEHNVTSEGGPQKFASKNFGENASYEVKLTKPGVIHYECTIHPTTMNGTIEVVK